MVEAAREEPEIAADDAGATAMAEQAGKQLRAGSTVAQLKDDIDSGRAGDKAGGFDPAAAPLGTDDEAGGARMSPDEIARIRAQERRGRPNGATANAASPEVAPNGRPQRPPYLAALALGAIAGAALGILVSDLL